MQRKRLRSIIKKNRLGKREKKGLNIKRLVKSNRGTTNRSRDATTLVLNAFDFSSFNL